MHNFQVAVNKNIDIRRHSVNAHCVIALVGVKDKIYK